ncbi:MAG: extracellular solute-binding protein, partial [Deltaproteobacteria bacterium]
PDLFIFAQDRIGDWATAGVIEPIDFWVEDELRNRFFPATVEALTFENALYGLPVAFKSTALYYNKRLVPEPPKTTDELIRIAKSVTDPKAQRYGLVYENANFYYHACWHQGFGARVFDERMRPVLDSPEAIRALSFARRLAKEEGIMPEEITATLVTSLFNEGKAAFVISGPWFMAELNKDLPFGVAVLPIISEVGRPATPFMGSEGIILSARSKVKAEAFEVMKFITSREAGEIMAIEGRQTPANRTVYENPRIKNDPITAVFLEQLAHTLPMPNSAQMRLVWSPITTAMFKVIVGDTPPAEALHEAQQKVLELIASAKRVR